MTGVNLQHVRKKERGIIERMCATITDDAVIADFVSCSWRVVAAIRAQLAAPPPPPKRRGGARTGAGRPPGIKNGTRAPKYLADEPLSLDQRYTTDAILGSRRLLVRMLETGTHWLPGERFHARLDELKAAGDSWGDPRCDLRRRINSL